jgi:mono/diheme cytochrome c family protein
LTVRAEENPTGPAPPQGAAEGQAIFDQQCIGCHSIGGGKRVGPDLKDIMLRRDEAWVNSFIANPNKMFETDPVAQQMLKEYNDVRMPFLGLSPDQVNAVVEYLRDPGALPANPALVSVPGDPATGQRLFSGETALAKGGPACIACHTVSGIASLGGGALGPDLTHVVQRLGETGLSAALNSIAFPTMQGPFANRPLTDEEIANLVAYMKSADQSQAPVAAIQAGAVSGSTLVVFAISLAGALVLFGLLLLIWSRLKKRYSPNLPVREA